MKSGLLNVCNLNTVLMLVILGLVVYCCFRQSRENMLVGTPIMDLCYGDIQPAQLYRPCHESDVQLSSIGIPTDATTELDEEALKKLIDKRLKDTQNERYAEEKDRRNELLGQYLEDEEEYIGEYLKGVTTAAGGTKPAASNIQAELRSNDTRSEYDNAPEFPNWPIYSGLNDITDVKGMNFSPYSNDDNNGGN